MLKKLLPNFYIINFCMLILIITLKFYGFETINTVYAVIYYIIYFIITIISIYSIRKLENNIIKNLNIYILPILYILTFNLILVIPTFLLYFTKPLKLKGLFYTLLSLLLVPIVIVIFLFLLFSGFGKDEVMQRIHSPNGQYTLVHILNDQGALGGANLVYLEKGYKYIGLKTSKRIYVASWSTDINMEWINYNTVKINENLIKIY